jgi:acetyl-CoA C-acetyltransferase
LVPARSPVAEAVLDRVFEMAGRTVEDVHLIDIYSCFPCAVTAIADHLQLPCDGSRALTLTGGLPYFGGPGNNYSMHALAPGRW